MATEAQINANRQNAQKSTGPRTAEGKAAVSDNAFKHGLFVDRVIVSDESQDEFDMSRERLLAELKPAGEMESIVAERFVTMSWRLKRAERLQNQSIDYLAMDQIGGYYAERFQEEHREAYGLSHDNPPIASDHLLMGRIATRDWSNSRVLDRMLMYERRIESSMYKAMHELGKLQKTRKTEQARAARRQSAQECHPARRHEGELKKQTQSVSSRTGVKLFIAKTYDDTTPAAATENKPNQTQLQGDTTPRRGGSVSCSSQVQGRLALG